jgi:hypothetical protein
VIFKEYKHGGRVILFFTPSTATSATFFSSSRIPLRIASNATGAACSSRTILPHAGPLFQQWAYCHCELMVLVM